MIRKQRLYFIKLVFVLLPALSTAQHIEVLPQTKQVSIRGVSVLNNKVAWLSSSNGYFAITTNGGKYWRWQQVKGFEKADFRDIEALSAKEAIIMSSGSPALILKTKDGGNTWKVNYRKDDSAYFLDAMDFYNQKHGIICGDPIDNKFLILETKDEGESWKTITSPVALRNQAAFAASGTCLRVFKSPVLVTGGSKAEIVIGKDSAWKRQQLPIMQGRSSQGAFSFAIDKKNIIVVGGDYQNNKNRDSTACYSTDSGLSWHLAQEFPSGYQSCVEKIGNHTFLSTGTAGTNISVDGGQNWKLLNAESFNVCRKAKHGNLVILAGDNGKIGILKN